MHADLVEIKKLWAIYEESWKKVNPTIINKLKSTYIDTFIVFDSNALPVIGTETRVNAGAEANIYSAELMELNDKVGIKEYLCGWYHSHPSYGCWLSGINEYFPFYFNKLYRNWCLIIETVLEARPLSCNCHRPYSHFDVRESRNRSFQMLSR